MRRLRKCRWLHLVVAAALYLLGVPTPAPAAIQAGPACGAYFNIVETGAAGGTSAGVTQDHPALGGQSTPTITWTPGTGTATSINLQASQVLSLAGAIQTIDLTALNTPIQTGRSFAKVRVVYIENRAAVDSGFTLKVYSGATNGWTNGPFPATPGITIPANGRVYIENPNTSPSWTTTASNKTVTFDPGANTFSIAFGIAGE